MADINKATMETIQTGRFAAAFKQARLEKRWKQEDLAKALHVKTRTVVSWETGERIPSAGMVFLLCMLFANGDAAPADLLSHSLLIAYLLDDVRRQTEIHTGDAFRQIVDRGTALLQRASEERQEPEREQETFSLLATSSVPEGHPSNANHESSLLPPAQQGETGERTLEQFFTLFERLRRHPELIPVADDFLREVAPQP